MPNSDVAVNPPVEAQDELTLLDAESPGRTMAGIIVAYCAMWILVTVLLSPVVPYDAVEAWHWGQAFEAGSPKNPWLVGTVAALAQVLPLSWPTFWFASHFVAMGIGAWGCWRLCQRLIPDTRQAMLAVMMLSLTASINIDLMPYNDNYLLMMLWPWMWFGFIRAVYDDRRYWLFLGIITALAGMAKYTTALYMPFMATIVIMQGRLKETLTQPWLWLGLLAGAMIVAPNLWWLAHHEFAAFRWFSDRVGGDSLWAASSVYLAVFYNVPLSVGLLMLARWRWQKPLRQETQAFVLLAVVPVLVLWVYFSLHGGMRTEWMMPFAMPLGMATVMCMTPGERGRFRLPLYVCYGMAGLVLCGFSVAKAWERMYSTQARHHIPALSTALNDWWHQRYCQPLRYVGGSRLGDWISIYAPDHPLSPTRWPSEAVQPFHTAGSVRFPNLYTPALTDQQLIDHGAMWVGEAGSLCSTPNVLEFDPALSQQIRDRIQYHTFVFRQDVMPQAIFSVCVGVLPPEHHSALSPLHDDDDKRHDGTVTE